MARSKTKAFTLIETVIALAILGMVSGVMITIFSESLNRIRNSGKTTSAVALARSLLEEAGNETPLQPGDKQGTFEGGFTWVLHTEPSGDADDREAWIMQPYQVSATVSWKDDSEKKEVTLKTLRLAPKEQ